MFLFRRKHQKLDELSEEPPPAYPQCDTSSGSDSIGSFDLNRYTHNDLLSTPITTELSEIEWNDFSPLNASDLPPNSRRFWNLGCSTKSHTKRQQLLMNGVHASINESKYYGERRKKDLAELDNTIQAIKPIQPVAINIGSSNSKYNDPLRISVDSRNLSREVTWRRRVSSLENFFKKGKASEQPKLQDSMLESVITKLIPFDTKLGPTLSLYPSFDATLNEPLEEPGRKFTRPKPTLEETVEKNVSAMIGKITSRGEEILENVPDWSVGSSSGDFYMSATSDDDETSYTRSEMQDSQGYTWDPVRRSLSSVDENDEDDFTTNVGCNSVQSCEFMTKEIGTFLNEILPRDSSAFNFLGEISNRKKRRKKVKRTRST